MIAHLVALFPNLANDEGFERTSAEDRSYNCIAWAAGNMDKNWWPDTVPPFMGYWPAEVPRVATIEAFEQAYTTLGYSPCDHGEFEEGIEKIALYADENGVPTHAARSIGAGKWTSKLGNLEDISHGTLEGVAGAIYGRVVRFLQRRIVTESP